jgi:hypothetical protein
MPVGYTVTAYNADTFNMTYRWVEYKSTWSGSWQWAAYFEPIVAVECLGPEVGRAEFHRRLGYIARHGYFYSSAANYPFEQPIDLTDAYVRIVHQRPGEEMYQAWIGFVEEQKVSSQGNVPLDQRVTAFQLSGLWDRKMINDAAFFSPSGGGVDFIMNPPSFNVRQKRAVHAKTYIGNRSQSKTSEGCYAFSHEGEKWTGYDICEYLLTLHGPDALPVPSLGINFDDLDQLITVTSQTGMTVWKILNRLVEKRTGFGLAIGEVNGNLVCNAYSVVGTTVNAGSSYLSANPFVYTFTLPTSHPYEHMIDAMDVRYCAMSQYDEVEFRSSPVLSTFSLEYNRNDELYLAWFGLNPFDYAFNPWKGAAPPPAPTVEDYDEARSSDYWRGIFGRFAPRDTWDFLSDGEPIFPEPNDDATFNLGSSAQTFGYLKEFESQTAFVRGKDYSVNPPQQVVTGRYSETREEFLPIFAGVKDDYKKAIVHIVKDQYVAVDRLNEYDANLHSGHVSVVRDQMGIMVQFSPKHYMAGSLPPNFISHTLPEFSYESVFCTVAMKGDYCGKYVITNNVTENTKRLVVTVPDCEFWYVAHLLESMSVHHV